jgi:hypothetical protein
VSPFLSDNVPLQTRSLYGLTGDQGTWIGVRIMHDFLVRSQLLDGLVNIRTAWSPVVTRQDN